MPKFCYSLRLRTTPSVHFKPESIHSLSAAFSEAVRDLLGRHNIIVVCRQDSAGVKKAVGSVSNLDDLIVTAALEKVFTSVDLKTGFGLFSAGSALVRCCMTVDALILEQRFDLFVEVNSGTSLGS